MALLMKKELDFHQNYLADNVAPKNPESYSKLALEFEYIRANTREFGNRLAAMPEFFDVLESWEVIVSGKEGVSLESLNMVMKTQDADDLIARAGSLAQTVKEYMVSKGFPLADISVGEDGWSVGVLCTEKQSRDLCYEVRDKYNIAINFKLLDISRRFAGHHIPGLYNCQDALRILSTYGDDLPTL